MFLVYFSFHLDVVLYVNTDNPVGMLGTIHFSDHVVDILDGKPHKKTIPPTAMTEELWEKASPEPRIRSQRDRFFHDLTVYGYNRYLGSLFEILCEDGCVNNCPIDADKLLDADGKTARFVVDVRKYFYPNLSMFALQYVKTLFSQEFSFYMLLFCKYYRLSNVFECETNEIGKSFPQRDAVCG